MTLDQRLDQLEQQNQRIERKNKRLTAALTLTVVAMCAAVTIAATGEKRGDFDIVTARYINLKKGFMKNFDRTFDLKIDRKLFKNDF